MVIRISDKKKNYSKVTKLLVKPPNIISTENGNMVLVEYGGDDNRGEYQYGRIIYYSEDGHLEELSKYVSYPNDFQGQKYEYDEENVKDFIKYYHLN